MKEKLTPSAVRKYFVLAAPALVLALLALLLMPLASRAQDTGYISGTVTDKCGAAIANATVVITSEGENLDAEHHHEFGRRICRIGAAGGNATTSW